MLERMRQRAPVLDPVERAGEAIFGVLMAVSITGSLSVATAGHEEIRTMLDAALGCNLAWGLTDAVMYLLGAATNRSRKARLHERVREARDPRAAHAIIAAELPEILVADGGEEILEAARRRLVATPVPSASLSARDWWGAVGVFALVVLVTFPLVIPFLLVDDVRVALRASNGVAIAILYAYGHLLGTHTGGRPWKYGLGVTALGVALVAIIMALGG
jgi:VIT1/CCC1 family predicted Fe2+/Mn2+ transporter